MSSHESYPLETLDLLMVEALQAEVGDAEPSPRVWERIRRRAQAWTARERFQLTSYRSGGLGHRPRLNATFSTSTAFASGGPAAWRWSLGAVRFPDHSGMLFRFAW